MKLRHSHAIMDNVLTFALYGQDWKLELVATMGTGPDDVDVDLECFGAVPLEEQEYALVWVDSCADTVVEDFMVPPFIEIHREFKEMLLEGFALQGS